ncbi:MAG: hypothetical protein MK102_08100 [Fuerstiella sp.]|nr:hypothetical protein [Fuerstiella sp.]
MSGTISKFKRLSARLRGTAATEIPSSFDVHCDCGRQITGVRSSSWQQSTCPSCHSTFFLLPANVYPSTGSVKSNVIGGTLGHRLGVVAGEMLRRKKQRTRSTGKAPVIRGIQSQKKESETANQTNPAQSVRWRPPRGSVLSVSPLRFVRRTFSPFRLLLTGMIVTVGSTIYWAFQNHQFEAARAAWHKETDAIPGLMNQSRFEQLEQVLGRATEAGRRIGLRGREWRYVLNLLQETRAVRSICNATLPELLSEASAQPLTENQISNSLELELMRGTFVIDGYIDPVDSNSGSYVLDIPVPLERPSVSVIMQLPRLGDYFTRNVTHRFVFAFRLAGVELFDNFGQETWNLTVAPESFVLLTSAKHCEQLGFSVTADPSLNDLLLSQRTFVEESQQWAGRREEPSPQQDMRRSHHQ